LDVTVAAVGRRDRRDRGYPVGPGFADADQDPRREWDGQLSGGLQGGQATLGLLVRRAAMGIKPDGQRLDHHPLAGCDRPEPGQLIRVERTGVGVGEQPGLLDDRLAHRSQVVHGRRVAGLGQPLGRRRVSQFGPFAQGE
jgi:hypothetical protein